MYITAKGISYNSAPETWEPMSSMMAGAVTVPSMWKLSASFWGTASPDTYGLPCQLTGLVNYVVRLGMWSNKHFDACDICPFYVECTALRTCQPSSKNNPVVLEEYQGQARAWSQEEEKSRGQGKEKALACLIERGDRIANVKRTFFLVVGMDASQVICSFELVEDKIGYKRSTLFARNALCSQSGWASFNEYLEF